MAKRKSTTSTTVDDSPTCPVARLALEYQKIHDTENETVGTELDETDYGWKPIAMLDVRERAVEAMAGALSTESVEGALFQLGLLNEIISCAYGWQAQEKSPNEAGELRVTHARAVRINNFLRREFNVPESRSQWLLAGNEDPFKNDADLWAKVEAERRREAAEKGGAS